MQSKKEILEEYSNGILPDSQHFLIEDENGKVIPISTFQWLSGKLDNIAENVPDNKRLLEGGTFERLADQIKDWKLKFLNQDE